MFNNSNFEHRLQKLEVQVKKLTNLIDPHGLKQHDEIPAQPHASGPTAFGKFIQWLKTDWLMKLGAFLLLLALTWFVTYAFAQNWIGPIGRVTLGILAGTAILAAGYFSIPKYSAPGQVLVATGATMVLLTVFAARSFYGFFSPTTAFGIMILVIALTATIATIRESLSLAVSALIGGAIVPLLVKTPHPDYVVLMGYIFALCAGVMVVASLRGWRVLTVLALLITAVFSIAVFDRIEQQQTVWLFMGLFYALFYIGGLAPILLTKTVRASDLLTTGLNTILLLYWIVDHVPSHWASIVASTVGLVAAITVYILFKNLQISKQPLYVHLGATFVFIGAATAFQLQGEWLTIAAFIEILLAVAITAFILKELALADIVSILYIVPIVLAIFNRDFSLASWIDEPLLNKHFFVVLISTLSLAGTAYVSIRNRSMFLYIHIVAASISCLAFMWLLLHNVLPSANIARGTALVLYSLAGVLTFYQGVRKDIKGLRVGAGVLLAGVVLRLLIVEVWDMPLSGRVITFVLIGALLITTAFFQKYFHPTHHEH